MERDSCSILKVKAVKFIYFLLFCSSHVGSRSHCSGRPRFGGMFHLLRFQKMLYEKEKAEESERKESRPPKNGKGRRRRAWREGV